MDEAITHVYPRAWVIAYADDCVVLHEDRTVLEHCQHLLQTWLTGIGLTLNEAKSHISHTLDGDQPGFEFLGFHIRQYRVLGSEGDTLTPEVAVAHDLQANLGEGI